MPPDRVRAYPSRIARFNDDKTKAPPAFLRAGPRAARGGALQPPLAGAQASAAGHDAILNQPAVGFAPGLATPTAFLIGLADRTYAGRDFVAGQLRTAKGDIPGLARALAERMADARFVGYPNVGHIPRLEVPEKFHASLLDFIK